MRLRCGQPLLGNALYLFLTDELLDSSHPKASIRCIVYRGEIEGDYWIATASQWIAMRRRRRMVWTEMTIFAVFACPMFGLLFAAYFKLDGLAARPRLAIARRRTSGVDRHGCPLCLDPDGSLYIPLRKRV